MKIYKYIWTAVLAAALATSSGMAQTVLTNSYTNSFPNGGNTGFFTGGSVASWIDWYGSWTATVQGDATKDAGGDPTSASLNISLPFTGVNQQVQLFGTFDNGGAYDNSEVIPLNIITNMGFDIYVDPATATNSSGNFGSFVMSLVDPGFNGGGRTINFTPVAIPGSAAGHWVHVNDANTVADALAMQVAGFTTATGIGFYIQSYGGYPTSPMNFWIDNLSVQTSSAPPPPPPPPTLTVPATTVKGLNVFASTAGVNDRQEVELVNAHGLSWIGNTGSGPVTYSFTISSFPKAPTYTSEAFLFLIPNPAGQESAADYNEAAVAWLVVQATPTGGQGIFQYKVNQVSGNNMLYGQNGYTNAPGSFPGGTNVLTSNGTNVWTESGNLTNVQSTLLLGTWTLKFTSDQNGMIIAPDGSTASFTIPSYYYTNFTETTSFNIYLGMQGNTGAAQNQAVVFSDFSAQGMPSPHSETFTGQTSLSAAWTNVYAARPAGVLIVPPTAPYWVGWTVPAIGYALIDSGSLGAGAVWKNVSTYTPILMVGTNMQLISATDLASANADYFRLIKRSFSQLQVLLPGETAAPGTLTGKTGTPTPVSLTPTGIITFTVNAVDSNWNPIPGITDLVNISTTDTGPTGANTPVNAALVNGTAQFSLQFQDTGSWTITAMDVTDNTKTANTSSSVTVTP